MKQMQPVSTFYSLEDLFEKCFETLVAEEWFHSFTFIHSGLPKPQFLAERVRFRNQTVNLLYSWNMVPILSFILLGVLASWSVSVDAQISSHYSSVDTNALFAKSKDIIANSKSLKDIFHATNFLKTSGQDIVSCQCSVLQELLSKANTGYDVYYGLSSSSACKCDVPTSSDLNAIARNSAQVQYHFYVLFIIILGLMFFCFMQSCFRNPICTLWLEVYWH